MANITSISTKYFRMNNAQQFFESISETSPTEIYIGLGKTTPWDDDTNPPQPQDTIKDNRGVWDTLLSLKKISPSDITLLVKRILWSSGVVYSEYSDTSTTLWDDNFYVMTDEFNVYKCIYNEHSSPSTIKPTGESTSNITTSDGYIWKFLYKISVNESIKFVSSTHIPVRKTKISTDDPLQWAVQEAAIPNSIDNFDIVNGGGNYQDVSGTTVSATINSITLESTSSSIIDFYKNSSVTILAGTGVGQVRKILSYDPLTKICTTATDWTTNPDDTSIYYISPTVTIIDNTGGNGWGGYSLVENNAIKEIITLNSGINYCNASAILEHNTNGVGAVISPIVSPINGHGYNPEKELPATSVGLYIIFSGDENGTAVIGNDFRKFSIIINPTDNNGIPASNLNYSMTTKLNISNVNGIFLNDEIVTGSSVGATGIIVNSTVNTIEISHIHGTFNTSDTIIGSDTGATANIDTVTLPEIKRYSGDVLFVKNIEPITRLLDEESHIKLTIPF